MELRCHASTPDGRLFLCGEKKKFLRYFKFESCQQILGNHALKRWASSGLGPEIRLGDFSFRKVEANSPTVEHVRVRQRCLLPCGQIAVTSGKHDLYRRWGSHLERWQLEPMATPFATSLRLPFCQQKLVIFVEENPWYFGETSKTSQRRVLQMGEEPRERSSALRPSQLDMKDMNKAAFCYPDWHRPFAPGTSRVRAFPSFFLGRCPITIVDRACK